MSDSPPSGYGVGRSRGRARGMAPGTGADSPPSAGSAASARGGQTASTGPVRGRGGYFTPIQTLPRSVPNTVGEGGNTVKLLANYFRLKTPSDRAVYDYRVDFEPDIDAKRVRTALLRQHADSLGTHTFDMMNNLKTLEKLPSDVTELVSNDPASNAPVKITITYTGEVDWTKPEMLRLFNMIMRKNLRALKFILMGRHHFDPDKKMPIPEHKLAVWQGFMTAINNFDGGLLLVCDTVFKVVRQETALDVLRRLKNQGGDFKTAAVEELANSIVLTPHNNKTYRIGDVKFDSNPTNYTFQRRARDGTTTTTNLFEYYKEFHRYQIKDPNQPLLLVKPDERRKREAGDEEAKDILLVPEMCQLTGLSDSLAGDFNVRRALTDKTRKAPQERVGGLYDFIKKMGAHPEVQQDLAAWSLGYEQKPLEIVGRVLPNENLKMAGGGAVVTWEQSAGDFSKEQRGKQMFKAPPAYAKWAIICTERNKNDAREFIETLKRVGGPMGCNFADPKPFFLPDDRTGTFVNSCKSVPGQAQMVVCILPTNAKDRYDAIKKVLCCENPIPSQCVVSRTIGNKQRLMSVCTKIAIQMAAKNGGEPWAVDIPAKNAMIIGYDTYHDSLNKGQSVGGFVATLNQECTKYFSKVSFHGTQNKEELSSNFAANVVDACRKYHEVNGRLPKRIAIYRDGVSEGQINHVYNTELEQVKGALRELGMNLDSDAGPEQTALSFVIVTKRINTRFFRLTGPQSADNPGPGTIVDTIVTRPERFDFYLVAQSVRQGTVAPTHFNVIEETVGNWKPKHHQMIAYKLCHLYYNWQGTVRVPAPCQYAHKLAFLVGTSLHREPDATLYDKLYFL